MDVQLYVYDLTNGMAKSMSRQLLGIQIDAVYHTAIVFGGIEYLFGAGVQTTRAGTTHHGRPMEIIPLGKTSLPMEVILEYLESLKQIYTPESYDLFAHNCNNFSNDFAMFLVGKGIPDHITNLPQQVLETPFGQMLRPQLDASMRSVTQAPMPSQSIPQRAAPAKVAVPEQKRRYGSVVNVTESNVLNRHLDAALDTCITIFFTSSTCAPCKLAYPTYDQLAEEYPNALFVKIDINQAREIASKYDIRATPTFKTYYDGKELNTWLGADPRQLKANVESAIEQAFPSHPHTKLELPILKFGSLKPTTYTKIPPLDKLTAKLGGHAQEAAMITLRDFVAKRQEDPRNATIPDMVTISSFFAAKLSSLPLESRFAAVDLLRCAVIDVRISSYLAEEHAQKTIAAIVTHVLDLAEACPHNLRLVTIHLLCNCFISSLFVKEMLNGNNQMLPQMVQLISSSLLDVDHATTRVAATSLAFNVASSNYRLRREEAKEGMSENAQVELAASILERIPDETQDDALKGLLLSLGYLLYFASPTGELMDLCNALEARSTISSCSKHPKIAKEVASLI